MKLTKEEELLNYVVLHSFDYPQEIGLLTGQMGLIIMVTRYARKRGLPVLDEVADCLFDNVVRQASAMREIDFASGLSGICWGVEFLTQNGIIPDTGQNLCGDMDNLITERDVDSYHDYSLETGLLGLWHYVWSRIQGNMQSSLELPFSESYLDSWVGILEKTPEKFPENALSNIRSAINGELKPTPLVVKPFIKPGIRLDSGNISLGTGLAGYIESEYLRP